MSYTINMIRKDLGFLKLKKKDILFLAVLSYIGVIAVLILFITGGKRDGYTRGVSAVYDKAVIQAQDLYNQKKQQGYDFSAGGCLTNDLFTGWAVDIVHNPRQKEDDLPKNQCASLVEGRAKYVVELDMKGNVVRVK